MPAPDIRRRFTIRHRLEKSICCNHETTFLGIDHPLLVSCSMNRRCLAAGDRIVLYTDGISEAVDKQGRMFGAHGIKRVVNDHHNSSSEDLNNAIVNELMRGHYAIGDDIMLMSVTIK